MISHTRQLFFLGFLLLAANAFLPNPDGGKFAGGLDTVQNQQVTVTYQLGDGKGSVSETDDGTLWSRYIEGVSVRPSEYEGQGDNTELVLRRAKETTGGQIIIEVKRFLVAFPNIVGSGASQIPPDAVLDSAKLKLMPANIAGPDDMAVNIYRILQKWEETESGYLRSPSWRQYQRSVTEGENRWENGGADVPVSSDSVSISSAVVVPRMPGTVLTVDVTEAVKQWMSGAPNYGLMIKFFEETIDRSVSRLAAFYSSESQIVEFRPKLEVVYTPKAVSPLPQPEPCREVLLPACPQGFVNGPTPVYGGDGRCMIGYDFRCKEISESPVSTEPLPAVTPPSVPAPAPKPAATLAPRPASPQVSEPSSEQAPVSAPSEMPEGSVQKPQPAASTSDVKIEEARPSEALAKIFRFFQKNILETWDRVIKFFR